MLKADLGNKVAIVTGGASGIGSAIAKVFAQNGCHMVIADINFDGAKRTVDECQKMGQKALAVKTDISKSSDVRSLFEKTISINNQLDILVNCAGVVETGDAWQSSEEAWDRMLTINTKGTFLCCAEAIRIMRPRSYGKIVNMGSISGKIGGIHSGAAYSASKAAVICYTKSLAKNVATNHINVNCIAPGLVETPMTADYPNSVLDMIPLRRKGTAIEIAYLALYLVSEAAAYITGATIDINGGLFMG